MMTPEELQAIKNQILKNKNGWSIVVVIRLVAEVERLQTKVAELEYDIAVMRGEINDDFEGVEG